MTHRNVDTSHFNVTFTLRVLISVSHVDVFALESFPYQMHFQSKEQLEWCFTNFYALNNVCPMESHFLLIYVHSLHLECVSIDFAFFSDDICLCICMFSCETLCMSLFCLLVLYFPADTIHDLLSTVVNLSTPYSYYSLSSYTGKVSTNS